VWGFVGKLYYHVKESLKKRLAVKLWPKKEQLKYFELATLDTSLGGCEKKGPKLDFCFVDFRKGVLFVTPDPKPTDGHHRF
jgi:hypothetical protein